MLKLIDAFQIFEGIISPYYFVEYKLPEAKIMERIEF